MKKGTKKLSFPLGDPFGRDNEHICSWFEAYNQFRHLFRGRWA